MLHAYEIKFILNNKKYTFKAEHLQIILKTF